MQRNSLRLQLPYLDPDNMVPAVLVGSTCLAAVVHSSRRAAVDNLAAAATGPDPADPDSSLGEVVGSSHSGLQEGRSCSGQSLDRHRPGRWVAVAPGPVADLPVVCILDSTSRRL